MKVLVLGSSGQIGTYLVDHLISIGHEVFEYDIDNDPSQDLRVMTDELRDIIRSADFVFFLAFDVGGSRYLSKYQHTFEFIDNNIKIMNNVFGLLKEFGIEFIFASSQMSNMSYSPYGVLKTVGECYTKAIDGRIVKFWNVYGLENDPEKSHVITDFIKKAIETGVIDMMTDGNESREFLYAEDCSEALTAVMENYKLISMDEELHITSFSESRIIDIANKIANLLNAEVIPSLNKDMVQMDRKNIANKYILEYWMPKTSIDDGIEKIIRGMYGINQ
jgi:nucleoside-diphosphate-sugar epimerase